MAARLVRSIPGPAVGTGALGPVSQKPRKPNLFQGICE